jgi:hypothetical protein
MRIVISALLLGISITATCQSKIPSFKVEEGETATAPRIDPQMNCGGASPDLSTFSDSSVEGDQGCGVPATYQWKNPLSPPAKFFHSLPADENGRIGSQTIFQNGQPNFHGTLIPQKAIAKAALIPTQWLNMKLEAIPTEWPNLKLFPTISQLGTVR